MIRPRIIRIKETCNYVGMSRATIYRLIAQEKFPAPVKIGAQAVGWELSELDKWADSLSARH